MEKLIFETGTTKGFQTLLDIFKKFETVNWLTVFKHEGKTRIAEYRDYVRNYQTPTKEEYIKTFDRATVENEIEILSKLQKKWKPQSI